MRSRSMGFPRDAATCSEFTARLMSPRAIRTRPAMASSSIVTFSFSTIIPRNPAMSSGDMGLNLKTAHLDWMGSMILEE